MKISLNWLSDFLPVDPLEEGLDHLVHQLTMLGFEVESIEEIDRSLDGVVCAEIIAVEPHPDADKLRLVTVEHGADETLTLVCGAPNVAVGRKVPLARLGARLPGMDNKPLKQAKIRGVVSKGMLCSEVELGLSDDHEGLMLLEGEEWTSGRPLAEAIGYRDTVLDIEITQNRGDAYSILGIARDLAALNGWELLYPCCDSAPHAAKSRSPEITIDDDCASSGCPRYAGQLMSGVTVGPSPRWMVDRLEAVGLRSISNVVDVTNYVMWELGHPLHAFDLRQLKGGEIRVRFARQDESFTTLDGEERNLGSEHTLICDAERPVALGGIMGGLNSGIEADTTEILLECAAFDPVNIRMGARRAGLSSDSSRRFERGVDFDNIEQVLERARDLIAAVAGATIAGPVADAYPRPREIPVIKLRPARCTAILGIELAKERMEAHLQSLGCAVASRGTDLQVTPPSWRFDLEREIDLIEEVVRLEGYEQVPEATAARVPLGQRLNPPRDFATRLREEAVRLGYRQVMGYSMVDPAVQQRCGVEEELLRIRNPLSEDMAALRSSLLPSLVQTAVYNLNRRARQLRLFELDREFHLDPASDTGCREAMHLVLLMCGDRVPESWQGEAVALDVLDMKESVLALLNRFQVVGLRFNPYVDSFWSANSVEILNGAERLGVFGQLEPRFCELLGTEVPLFGADLDLEAMLACKRDGHRFEDFPRQPPVLRDLSFLCPAELPSGELEALLAKAGKPLLQSVRLFDIYQGKGVAAGKVSRSYRLEFNRADQTLRDEDVDPLIETMIKRAAKTLDAELRG